MHNPQGKRLQTICLAIANATNADSELETICDVGGGCIYRTQKLALRDGRKFFLKLNEQRGAEFFQIEKIGLETLAAVGKIRIPNVICFGEHENVGFLVLEYIDTGQKTSNFETNFARQLAELHLAATDRYFGFDIRKAYVRFDL